MKIGKRLSPERSDILEPLSAVLIEIDYRYALVALIAAALLQADTRGYRYLSERLLEGILRNELVMQVMAHDRWKLQGFH